MCKMLQYACTNVVQKKQKYIYMLLCWENVNCIFPFLSQND